MPMLKAGLDVTALDYSEEGLRELQLRATRFEHQLVVAKHDVHEPLPFPNESFDGCYSHMLFNMALTTEELTILAQEARRVLRPRGVLVYTARHTRDAHYGVGADFGDNRFENGGFVVHFFDRDLVDLLADGFELDDVTTFTEGELPRKLFRVTMTRSPIT
jgi:SAM-dependent methyltransferase